MLPLSPCRIKVELDADSALESAAEDEYSERSSSDSDEDEDKAVSVQMGKTKY